MEPMNVFEQMCQLEKQHFGKINYGKSESGEQGSEIRQKA